MRRKIHSFVCKIENKILWSKVAQTGGNLQLLGLKPQQYEDSIGKPASLICTLWTPFGEGKAVQRILDQGVQLNDGSNWGRGRQPIGSPFGGLDTDNDNLRGFKNSV